MKLNDIKRAMGGAALTIAMAFAVMIASSDSAQAQYRDNRDYNDRYGYQQEWSRDRVRDYAMKLGYHNAYTDANRAARSGYRVSYRDMPGYRTDTNGYLAQMGHRDDYRNAYRRGYEQGFNESMQGRPRRYDRGDVERVLGGDLEAVYEGESDYDNEPNYGRNRDRRDDDWRNRDDYRGGRNDIARIAEQNGYREGLRSGQEDRSRRRSFDYQNDDRFRDASSGYRSEYGNRDFYRQAFREGYRRGYEEGYRQNTSRLRWPF